MWSPTSPPPCSDGVKKLATGGVVSVRKPHENFFRVREAGAEEDRPLTDATYRQVNDVLVPKLKC